MRLAMSNIAWSMQAEPLAMRALREHGFTGIEVAPTKLWPAWEGATLQAARQYRERAATEGFLIPALQAVLFDKPECRLFGTPSNQQSLREHLRKVYALAESLGASAIVLGAPKNRDKGALSDAEALRIAADFFRLEGEAARNFGVCLCIEPNPVAYGCNFVTTSTEGLALVKAANSRGFRLHLDAAGMHLSGEDATPAIARAAQYVAHYHVSEPNLGDFHQPQVDHAKALRALRASSYAGWLSVEMREAPDALAAIDTAARYLAALVAG